MTSSLFRGRKSGASGGSADSGSHHVDVLVIGAGISGISAAHHLHCTRPGTSITVLEARDEVGGTWTFFKYPGLRSDSDMATYGFGFKQWTSPLTIAQGPYIAEYLRKTVEDCGLRDTIQFGRTVTSAAFDSTTGRWTVRASTRNGRTATYTAKFLYISTGYYDYKSAYTPDFPGIEDFKGTVVHPQFWPEDLVYTDKEVVVIGSGATAITLLPAMAPLTKHITMLQRSPSYILNLPSIDISAHYLNKVLGQDRAARVIRRKNIAFTRALYKVSKRAPRLARKLLTAQVRAQLPAHVDAATHFAPKYNPWEQRLCIAPGGDLFDTLGSDRASIVTDHIERFTATGIRLRSGQQLDADIVVTATGLNMLAFGGMKISVDGEEVNVADRYAFKAMMLSGVPNLAFAVGYSNISWTLKVELAAQHFCRVLDFMDAYGHDTFVPIPDNPGMERRPILDLKAGYVQRRIGTFPHAGDEGPWTLEHAYELDLERLGNGPVADPELHFGTVGAQLPPRSTTRRRPAALETAKAK
ncbi:flavin-containing monooxygenase [Nocardia stercoris]|uniref:NAD(P)/FAD-dependent oxidoreductase n=1 Tax=Nocardia stercoris TaxID=2483361 RepID=A0A3M2L0C1_9NOCA|nr:NAD(P)/FAD-dependent oxidoreductase [Nocardia stercoris]RMI30160.1 NAD(P)/FAD-dependent oxidoreductase [Nocardia stercoris]